MKTWLFKNYKLGRPIKDSIKKKNLKKLKSEKKFIMDLSAKYHRINSGPPYLIMSSLTGELHRQASQKAKPQHWHGRENLPRGENSFLWAGADRSVKRPKKHSFVLRAVLVYDPGLSQRKGLDDLWRSVHVSIPPQTLSLWKEKTAIDWS